MVHFKKVFLSPSSVFAGNGFESRCVFPFADGILNIVVAGPLHIPMQIESSGASWTGCESFCVYPRDLQIHPRVHFRSNSTARKLSSSTCTILRRPPLACAPWQKEAFFVSYWHLRTIWSGCIIADWNLTVKILILISKYFDLRSRIFCYCGTTISAYRRRLVVRMGEMDGWLHVRRVGQVD